MNVLVVPEDFRKDQWMLKPIVEAMMRAIGKPKACVQVCLDPLLGGIDAALKWEEIETILDRYPMVDLFLLCVDRDLQAGREEILRKREERSLDKLSRGWVLLGENAWQEIEVWVLAGMVDLPVEWSWQEIRGDRDPKERFFLPYARQRGLQAGPGEGRKVLGAEAARNYKRLRTLCQEDIGRLERRTREWLDIYEGAAADCEPSVRKWMSDGGSAGAK